MEISETNDAGKDTEKESLFTPKTTPTKLKEVRKNFEVIRKKRMQRDDDEDGENHKQKIHVSDGFESIDCKGKIISLEFLVIEYERIINDLIDIADDLQKDNDELNLAVNNEMKKMKLEHNEQYKSLDKRIMNLERVEDKQLSWAEALSKPGTIPLNKEQMDLSIRLTIEKEDEERRSRNVVIFGVEKSASVDGTQRILDDRKKLEEIFDTLKVDKKKIVSLRRFKEKPGSKHPAAILVSLAKKEDRNEVVAVAKNLKNSSTFSNVYLNPDLNEQQRTIQKELRRLRKEKNDAAEKNNEPFRFRISGSFLKMFRLATENERGGGTEQKRSLRAEEGGGLSSSN